MRAYGRLEGGAGGGDDEAGPSPLAEVALALSLREVEALRDFLDAVWRAHAEAGFRPGHDHLRDFLRARGEVGPGPEIVLVIERER